MEWTADLTGWLGLGTLILLEIVLGIDNLIFIAILVDKLPPRQRHLATVADERLSAFSSGMSQKVGLAQALINEPRVLLLDEPTAGLDPIGRHDLLGLIRRLAIDKGVTVLFSTHILTDVEQVCERVAILNQGRLIAVGDLADLKQRNGIERMDDLYLALVRHAA